MEKVGQSVRANFFVLSVSKLEREKRGETEIKETEIKERKKQSQERERDESH